MIPECRIRLSGVRAGSWIVSNSRGAFSMNMRWPQNPICCFPPAYSTCIWTIKVVRIVAHHIVLEVRIVAWYLRGTRSGLLVVDLCDGWMPWSLISWIRRQQTPNWQLFAKYPGPLSEYRSHIYPANIQFNISDPGKGVWYSNEHMLDIRAQLAWMRTGDPCQVKQTRSRASHQQI